MAVTKKAKTSSELKESGSSQFFLKRFWRWRQNLQPQTPHKSFRWTRRRDYVRPLTMPGYIAFTTEVWKTIWRYKNTFGLLILTYALMSAVLVGLVSQSTYSQIGDLLRTSSGDIFKGNVGQIGQAGLLLVSAMSGALNPNLTDTQQVLSALLIIMMWLTTIWLLRAFLAGHKPKFRDGLYNAGAPIIPTLLLALVLVVQLIPAAIAAIGLSAALPTGLVSQGVEAMVFWVVVLLLFLLSLYWITSSFIALVIITLPGMYPFNALKTASELVVGRRLPVVLRIVWLFVITIILWAVVMIPIILFDAWLKGAVSGLQWLPIVPLSLLIASSISVLWITSYIYLLYRKVVDDGTAPA